MIQRNSIIPKSSMIQREFQLEVWTLTTQKSTVIPPSCTVLFSCHFLLYSVNVPPFRGSTHHFCHFPSKSALHTKSAWEAGSQDPTFSEGSQIYHLKCFYTSKMKRSLFSVLLHNDESYYWALLEPGRLHLPTSLPLRPWGWWQRPAGKFSWLTNLYSPDIHYQLDLLDQDELVLELD